MFSVCVILMKSTGKILLTIKSWIAWEQATAEIDTSDAERLNIQSADEVEQLYRESYPDVAFERESLGSGFYFVIRDGGELVAVVGVHAISTRYGVAVTGNLATHPKARRK